MPNVGGDSEALDESCSSPGNCSLIGYYEDGSGNYQAYVENIVRGKTSPAQEVPGFEALNLGGNVAPQMVISCPTSGNCSAGGTYYDANNNPQAFVVSEVNGKWASVRRGPWIFVAQQRWRGQWAVRALV